MGCIDVLKLLCIEHERSRLLVQFNCRGDGVKTVADHPRRVLNSEVYRHRDIDPANNLLKHVLQILPYERFGLGHLPGRKKRRDCRLETICALRLTQNRTHRRRTLKLIMVPPGRASQPVKILLQQAVVGQDYEPEAVRALRLLQSRPYQFHQEILVPGVQARSDII